MGKQTKRSDVALFLFLKNCKAGWKKNSGKLELQQHHLHLGEFVEAEERLRQRVSGNSLWAQPSEQASLKSWCTYGSHGIGIGRRGGKGQGQRCFFLYDGFSQEAEDYTKLQGSWVVAMECVSPESQNAISIPPPSVKGALVLWLEQL